MGNPSLSRLITLLFLKNILMITHWTAGQLFSRHSFHLDEGTSTIQSLWSKKKKKIFRRNKSAQVGIFFQQSILVFFKYCFSNLLLKYHANE